MSNVPAPRPEKIAEHAADLDEVPDSAVFHLVGALQAHMEMAAERHECEGECLECAPLQSGLEWIAAWRQHRSSAVGRDAS